MGRPKKTDVVDETAVVDDVVVDGVENEETGVEVEEELIKLTCLTNIKSGDRRYTVGENIAVKSDEAEYLLRVGAVAKV